MTIMRKIFICFFSMLLWFGLSRCAEAEPEQPENVEIHFFYNQPCASCDGTKELFEIVSEELDDVSDLYPYMVSVYNVFRKEDAQIRDSELKKLGFQEELAGSLTYPIMTVNGNIYFGTDSIRSSIREAYLTAGEDLFVYGRGVYDPTKNETLKQQLDLKCMRCLWRIRWFRLFLPRGYLAGYEAISSGLYPEMEQGAGLGMKYPSEKGIFK